MRIFWRGITYWLWALVVLSDTCGKAGMDKYLYFWNAWGLWKLTVLIRNSEFWGKCLQKDQKTTCFSVPGNKSSLYPKLFFWIATDPSSPHTHLPQNSCILHLLTLSWCINVSIKQRQRSPWKENIGGFYSLLGVLNHIPGYSISFRELGNVSLYLILSVKRQYKELCMVSSVYKCRFLSHLLLWQLWTQDELSPSSQLLSCKYKLRCFWDFIHHKVKTLFVQIGWQRRGQQVPTADSFTQFNIPVMLSGFSRHCEGAQRWGVCVRTVVLCCMNRYVPTRAAARVHKVWLILFSHNFNNEFMLHGTYWPVNQTSR